MREETANEVLRRECSEEELSLFEAYLDALSDDDIDEAAHLFDQFPAAARGPLMEFMQRKLDAASRPPVELAPVPKEPRPDPNEPIIAIGKHRVAVSRWGDEDEHPADDAALEAFSATSPQDRRRLEGKHLIVRDCRRLAKRTTPGRRESRPAPSRKRSLARSSSRSADSGEDGESGESEPPSERAPCEWWGRSQPQELRRQVL